MFWRYKPYVSVAEKQRKAEKKLKQLMKKNPNLQPVRVDGKTIAKTWWGKAWNTNLEKYADYSNRIGRGRSYIRQGSVLDLKISEGKIESLVMGSSSKPYSIVVQIKGLAKNKWADIKIKAKDQIDSLQELMDGKFPKNLGEFFTSKGEGLFPAPKEIKLSCSCPDWAEMCKHVAATLFGVGARLDKSPELFFKLRGVNVDDLVSFAVKKRKTELLQSVIKRKKTSRVIKGDDSELSSLFDIDLTEDGKEAAGPVLVRKTVAKKKTAVRKKSVKKVVKKKVSKKKVVKKKAIVNRTVRKKIGKKKVAGTFPEKGSKKKPLIKKAIKKKTVKKTVLKKNILSKKVSKKKSAVKKVSKKKVVKKKVAKKL